MNAQETWQEIIEFYRDVTFKGNTEIYKSFCDSLLRLVISSKYSNSLFASQSLHTLIISTSQTWPERILVAHIRVNPSLENHQGRIELFLEPQNRGDPGSCHFKIECSNEEMYNYLEPLLNQLIQQTNASLENK